MTAPRQHSASLPSAADDSAAMVLCLWAGGDWILFAVPLVLGLDVVVEHSLLLSGEKKTKKRKDACGHGRGATAEASTLKHLSLPSRSSPSVAARRRGCGGPPEALWNVKPVELEAASLVERGLFRSLTSSSWPAMGHLVARAEGFLGQPAQLDEAGGAGRSFGCLGF